MKFWLSVLHLDPREVVEVARWCEELGYEGILVADHLVFPEVIESKYPYAADGVPRWDPATAWPDAWVTIGAMAAVTTRLRFSTNVYIVPARQPLVVAKAVSTAAYLSSGRVSLGAGVGWMAEEFVALGEDFHTRGRRIDEMIEILRLLWTGKMVEHHGAFYDLPRMQMSPAPGPVPIWIGGHSDVALRRAARADGWIGSRYPLEEGLIRLGQLQAWRRELGADDRPYEVLMALDGPADDLDAYRRWEEAGVTGVMCTPHLSLRGPGTLREKLEAFATTVLTKA